MIDNAKIHEINDSVFKTENFPVLTTERTILNKLDLTDLEDFFRLRSDEKTAEEMGVAPFKEIHEAEEFILNTQYSYEFKMGINWSIYLKKSFNFIGTAGIWRIEREHFRGELGYSLLPEYRNHGIMTEVLIKIIKTAFNKINLHSLEANVDPGNKKSIDLLKKLGFKKEGYLKENFYLKDRFLDTVLFSLINNKQYPS